jgi:hypothetical protein
VKLSEDTTYQFNRYATEGVDEEPNKDDPREDSTNPLFWMAREFVDDDVVRRQLCIDMITITSPRPLDPPLEPLTMVSYSIISAFRFNS